MNRVLVPGQKLVDLDAQLPHWQGPMLCTTCTHTWQAVVGPVDINADGFVGVWWEGEWFSIYAGGWECPHCNELTGVPWP